MKAGDIVVIRSGGGGGYGPAHAREIDHVLSDLREGYVSAEKASTVYGVVMASDGTIDAAATTARRAELESLKSKSAPEKGEAP